MYFTTLKKCLHDLNCVFNRTTLNWSEWCFEVKLYLNHTFSTLFSKWFQDSDKASRSSECFFRFQSILKEHFFEKLFFTSTEVWKSILKVSLSIWSINEVHLPNILHIYSFSGSTNEVYFECTFFLRGTYKVYLSVNSFALFHSLSWSSVI